jgi:Flp pilus assembly protein TadD
MIPNWRTKWKLGPNEHCERALSFLSQGRFSRAVRHARKAVSLQPNDTLSYCILGRACSATQRGRYPAAYNAYLKAIKLRPALHEPYEGLGDILEWINDHREAIKAFKRAARLLDRSHGEKIVLNTDLSIVFISDEPFGEDENERLGRLKVSDCSVLCRVGLGLRLQ